MACLVIIDRICVQQWQLKIEEQSSGSYFGGINHGIPHLQEEQNIR